MTARAKEHPLDLDFWAGSMQKVLEQRAGARLWHDFLKKVIPRVDEGEALALENDSDSYRYLWRLGLVPLSASGKQAVDSLIVRAGEASGLMPAEITILVRVFASGCYGLLDKGVCSDVPECGECPFAMLCRYAARKNTRGNLPDEESLANRLNLGLLGALGVPELLALLISGGRHEMKAYCLAEKLLSSAGSLRTLGTWSITELEKVEGVSKEVAVRLRSSLDLAVYWASEPRPPGTHFSQARDFFKYYKPRLRDQQAEFFIVAMLDTKNRLIGEVVTGGGGLSGATVDPKVVLKRAIRDSASRIVFIHNHPSGDPTPSPEDLDITARLVQVSCLAGIKVLDHIIIGGDSYISMSEGGYI
jgi:DNA repair protein RadC